MKPFSGKFVSAKWKTNMRQNVLQEKCIWFSEKERGTLDKWMLRTFVDRIISYQVGNEPLVGFLLS